MTAYELAPPSVPPVVGDPVLTCEGPGVIRCVKGHLANGRWLCDVVLDEPVVFDGHLVLASVDMELEA